MLKNLNDVRKSKGVSLTDMADVLHVKYQTVADKINEKSDFKFKEAVQIQEKFFPEYQLKFLFTPNQDQKDEE